MDPEAFSTTLYKWNSQAASASAHPPLPPPQTQTQNRFFETRMPSPDTLPSPFCVRSLQLGVAAVVEAGGGSEGIHAGREGELKDFFKLFGLRNATVAKLAELGFTVNTLLEMSDQQLDVMIRTLSQTYGWDLLYGEVLGIKSAVHAGRRERQHHQTYLSGSTSNTPDALSQEGLSEELVQQQQQMEAGGSGGEGISKKKKKRARQADRKTTSSGGGSGENVEEDDEDNINGRRERHREHPFTVTVPGEIARGNKNSLDYLFHLYEQCRQYFVQVQSIARDRGERCPTKVTNQVFRYAIEQGATYINKPKIRHYVHCYAFHCLDREASDELRLEFKERGENVGAWREACYLPLVTLAGRNSWDIDAIFNANPLLSIWHVPTRLRKLCHTQRSSNVASASNSSSF